MLLWTSTHLIRCMLNKTMLFFLWLNALETTIFLISSSSFCCCCCCCCLQSYSQRWLVWSSSLHTRGGECWFPKHMVLVSLPLHLNSTMHSSGHDKTEGSVHVNRKNSLRLEKKCFASVVLTWNTNTNLYLFCCHSEGGNQKFYHH